MASLPERTPARCTTVYLGLGSNLGDRRAFLHAAVDNLVAAGVLREPHLSNLYETDPVGGPPQPLFLNAVARGQTALSPEGLLARCLETEAALGRVRAEGQVKAARTIDIDLLLFGDEVIDSAVLTVPHPRLLERPFVLIPLADVAEVDLVHPGTGRPLAKGDSDVSHHPAVQPWPWPGLYRPPTRG